MTYGAPDDFREPLIVDAEEFIGVKSYKAKGKRVTTLNVAKVTELEPTRFPEPEPQDEAEYTEEGDETTPSAGVSPSGADEPVQTVDPPSQTEDDLMDDLTGQLKLF